MKKKRQVTTIEQPEPGYPSLPEHLASRRRFLAVAGATVAGSAVLTACDRAMGAGGDSDAGTEPDAAPPRPDATVEIGGVAPEPNLYTLRIPAEYELYAYLVDGGAATFWVSVLTYDPSSYQALADHLSAAGDRCRSVVEDFTYDALNTAQGVAGAEDDLLDSLDTYCQELCGHSAATLEAVTLTITYLTPIAEIDGDMPSPSYP